MNNHFEMTIQRHAWYQTKAEEHFDTNRWDQAFYWAIAAQILKPKPPVIDWPELLAKPREVW